MKISDEREILLSFSFQFKYFQSLFNQESEGHFHFRIEISTPSRTSLLYSIFSPYNLDV